MKETLDTIIEFLKIQVESNIPIIGIIFGMLIIVLESILPILPLAVFIAVNMLVFGNIIGFITSFIATSTGCALSFFICRKGLSDIFYSKIKEDGRINKLMKKITKIKFSNLVLIIALPFTPAFVVNIASGLSKLSFKKFISAILIGKLSIVYFWGFIGTTFIESITDIKVLIEIGLILLITYILSKLITKKLNI